MIHVTESLSTFFSLTLRGQRIHAAVMDAIRAGVREIPGLRIFDRMQARTRT